MRKDKNIFTDEISFKSIDRLRLSYLLVAVSFFFLTEMGRYVYRPYIYSNNINDWGIADSMGNLGGIIVQIFFTLAVLNSKGRKALNVILFMSIGYIFYEIIQPYLPKGTFDIKDVYGTIVGAVLSLIILAFIRKLVKNKLIYKFN